MDPPHDLLSSNPPTKPNQTPNFTSPAILLLHGCVNMEVRRTLTMNWDGLGDLDNDEDLFFDAQRLSTIVPQDLDSSSSDEEFDDSRTSFSSATDFSDFSEFQTREYDMWMAAPKSINERRRRLLQDMGLRSNKDLLAFSNANKAPHSTQTISTTTTNISPSTNICKTKEKQLSHVLVKPKQDDKLTCESKEFFYLDSHVILSRSKSSSIDTKTRNEEMFGSITKQCLTRTFSGFSSTPFVGLSSPIKGQNRRLLAANTGNNDYAQPISQDECILLIKNLDNGKQFIVKECNNEGNWNKLSDVTTGNQITMEEFEKNAGHSQKVKELMKKEVVSGDQKLTPAIKSKKKSSSLFKNIKLGSTGTGASASKTDLKTSSEWVKGRVHGKAYKELTALHMNQEIKGHNGSIWTMKFTYDGRYLASAGEDAVIQIWEVLEFDVMAMRNGDDLSSAGRPPLPESTPGKKKMIKKGKKKKEVPDYVHVPETVFGLSETPFCTLEGHTDDVLDLSWSRSRLLLSSSMDKTVRLWDVETKNCLKQFYHTDYVTCIQFNPADDDYFISGSLDSKVRIWNIPDRHVVDWIDLHEMVTAVGYSNDGKVSVVGSDKGICRFYNTADCKLEFKEQVELKTKKKPLPRKITGFQFSTCNPSEVLVTSADSRVRILNGTKVVQKFKGYKNNNSQLSAYYSPDSKFIISASEDSQVYIWRHEETKGKHKYPIITSYEHFPCKEVSVAAPWPGSSKFEQPLVAIHSKKHSKRFTTTLSPPATGSSSTHDDINQSKPSSTPVPQLHKRNNSSTDNIDEDTEHPAYVAPSESFNSVVSSSGRFDDLTSPSSSKLSSEWSGNHGHSTIQATAWGLVIVTAGLCGEIKVFQNVGLPFKASFDTIISLKRLLEW
ncbi:hypothetical protein QVD17_22523 [Tagetes erecta]|uniref:WD repeat-containing protein 44 n=1 Tax=Tagetes erecta TaxID=13708 RepID=A0AAD8NTM7_TARER|nr:hypothetical protein QVD17_22523 [Tagetes erecta]